MVVRIAKIVAALYPEEIEREPCGSVRIKHCPTIGSIAYLHTFFSPLKDGVISDFFKKNSLFLHPDLMSFYTTCNGLEMFRKISINGILNMNGISPISLRYGNLIEVPAGLPKKSIVIGGYDHSSSQVGCIVISKNGRVFVTKDTTNFEVVSEWSSLESFLLERVEYFLMASGLKVDLRKK